MSLAELLPYLLVVQAVMGGFDTLVNHEIIEKLPHRPTARREIGLHSVREATYGSLFVGLGWFAWQGAFALVIAALLLLEWGAQPTGLRLMPHGWTSWALLLFGATSFAWSLRDLLAWRRLATAA